MRATRSPRITKKSDARASSGQALDGRGLRLQVFDWRFSAPILVHDRVENGRGCSSMSSLGTRTTGEFRQVGATGPPGGGASGAALGVGERAELAGAVMADE